MATQIQTLWSKEERNIIVVSRLNTDISKLSQSCLAKNYAKANPRLDFIVIVLTGVNMTKCISDEGH